MNDLPESTETTEDEPVVDEQAGSEVPADESTVSDAIEESRPGDEPEVVEVVAEEDEPVAELPVTEPARKADIRRNMDRNRSTLAARRQHDKYSHLNK